MTKLLLDDCFLHDGDRLRHGEALTILRARVSPIADSVMVAVWDASGRILAQPVTALLPVPPHTNAAVAADVRAGDEVAFIPFSEFGIVGGAA